MSQPQTNSGTRFFICPVLPNVQTLDAYALLNFTQVRGVRLLGDVVREHQTRVRAVVDDEYVRTVRTGAMVLPVLALDIYRLPADAGQAIFKTAFDAPMAYTYKVVRPDGTGYYLTGKVIKDTNGVGDSAAMQITAYEISMETPPLPF